LINNEFVWCSLPWTHLCIRPDDTLKPCCRYQYAPGDTKHSVSLDSIASNGSNALNTKYLKGLRSDLLKGIPRVECKKCYIEEQNHRNSLRTNMNDVIDVNRNNVKLNFDSVQYLELSIDNICNLQCRMCDSKFSSKLQLRDKHLGLPVHKKLEPSYEKLSSLDLSKLTRIKLLGGEPFITPNFEKFIDFISDHVDVSQIHLDINTNGSVIPDENIAYKLNKFLFLEFNISLDSYAPSNDYQRWGGSYIQTFNNVKQYEQIFDKKEISYHSTISILTGNDLAQTVNTLQDLHGYHISIDFVRQPEHLCMLYAPQKYVDWVLQCNESNPTAYSVMKNFLKDSVYEPIIWSQFLEYTSKLDQYYNVNLADYNPELVKILNATL